MYMCHSLLAALFSKTFLSHPPFKYPRSAPVVMVQSLPKSARAFFRTAS